MNTANRDRAIRIIKGLLEKKTERGAFLAEEVAATAKIQELLERYQLTLMDVKTQTLNEEMKESELDTGRKNLNPGEAHLANAIASGFDCRLITTKRNGNAGYIFMGYASDVEVAEYTYVSLLRKLTILADDSGRKAGAWKQKLFRYRNNFLIGAAVEIRRRMMEEKQQRTAASATKASTSMPNPTYSGGDVIEQPQTAKPVGTSLTLLKQPKVDEFVKNKFPRLIHRPASKVKTNYNAIEEGRQAGRSIEIRKGVCAESCGLLS